MNIYEIDWRNGWLETILKGLKSGFGVVESLQKTEPWFDGLWLLEFSEPVVGMGFVGAQAYILGVITDLAHIKGKTGEEFKQFVTNAKKQIYSDDPHPLSHGQSRIDVINAAANYYKHHDEWNGWPDNYTTRSLRLLSINKDTEFPCIEIARTLFGSRDFTNLEQLQVIVSDWRQYVLHKHVMTNTTL